MSEPERNRIADAPPAPSADCEARIAALRAAGADRFDPVRWRYLEALATRAAAHQGGARRMLDARLAQALAGLQDRFDRARRDAKAAIEHGAARYPHAAQELQRHADGGDFKGLRRLLAILRSREAGAPLGALVRQLEQQSPDQADARREGNAGPRAELKAVRQFRNTWAKLSVDMQVTQALEQAPKNAGPINSHMLVLRSLALMRDISPDYLNRFMSYADALLCLDEYEKEKSGNPKKQPAARAAKK